MFVVVNHLGRHLGSPPSLSRFPACVLVVMFGFQRFYAFERLVTLLASLVRVFYCCISRRGSLAHRSHLSFINADRRCSISSPEWTLLVTTEIDPETTPVNWKRWQCYQVWYVCVNVILEDLEPPTSSRTKIILGQFYRQSNLLIPVSITFTHNCIA